MLKEFTGYAAYGALDAKATMRCWQKERRGNRHLPKNIGMIDGADMHTVMDIQKLTGA